MSISNAVNEFERRLINLSNDLNYNGVKFTIFANADTVTVHARNVRSNNNLLLTELSNMGSEIADSHGVLVTAITSSAEDVAYEESFGQCLVKV